MKDLFDQELNLNDWVIMINGDKYHSYRDSSIKIGQILSFTPKRVWVKCIDMWGIKLKLYRSLKEPYNLIVIEESFAHSLLNNMKAEGGCEFSEEVKRFIGGKS